MRSRRNGGPGSLIGGIVLLIVGVAFLLRNAGVIDVDWSVIWPAIVIAIGIVLILGAFNRSVRGDGDSQVSVAPDGARRLELSLRVGAGRYSLRGGASALVEATADEPTIEHALDRRGDLARVRLTTAMNPWSWGWRSGLRWRIGVASDVPTILDVQAGAGEFDFDLSSIALVSASLGIGAASLRITLPHPTGDVPIRVEGGAASFTFHVPAGVEARVLSSGLVSSSGPTESPGYASASDRVTVTVTGGAASVRIVPEA